MRDAAGCVYDEECEFGNIGGAFLVEWGCGAGGEHCGSRAWGLCVP